MRPVARRVKSLDERRMMILNRFECLGLLNLKVRQTQLNFELRFDQVLPGFAFFDMDRLDF